MNSVGRQRVPVGTPPRRSRRPAACYWRRGAYRVGMHHRRPGVRPALRSAHQDTVVARTHRVIGKRQVGKELPLPDHRMQVVHTRTARRHRCVRRADHQCGHGDYQRLADHRDKVAGLNDAHRYRRTLLTVPAGWPETGISIFIDSSSTTTSPRRSDHAFVDNDFENAGHDLGAGILGHHRLFSAMPYADCWSSGLPSNSRYNEHTRTLGSAAQLLGSRATPHEKLGNDRAAAACHTWCLTEVPMAKRGRNEAAHERKA